MTLHEVAAELARRMNCTVEPAAADAQSITVRGKGYHFVVAGFFGGWQATLYLPDQDPITYYGEAVESLEIRLKGKLSGRPVD
ncbi:MAG: hypothetical protein A6D92_12470 [Symbiobacterium thermophilum]|uniref:Uncharacterized protein n=1 Tax=Symbiobacterium thermophilum TaxID=2734 RepID=A0A1Y2T6K0_SYMTR|nr:MAG: hypothetical protein A6D92_12470 [Symbiobacterium thermophilum]PZN73688.1 MAG: hypothetical protein DIU55_02480 [Bacillota bacterium]